VSNVAGEIVVPDRAPTVSGTQVVVRVRDITYSDAPVVRPVAQQNVVADVAPGARIPFSIDVPDDALAKVATREMELNLEVHVDLQAAATSAPATSSACGHTRSARTRPAPRCGSP
jgi:hypothetical protein